MLMSENNNEGLSFVDLLQIVLKNIVLICSITFGITILGGVYVCTFVHPTYSSSSTVAVAIENKNVSSTDSVDYINTLRVVQTIAQLTTTDLVLDNVSQVTNIKSSTLKSMIKTESSETSYFINISDKASTPERAQIITDETIKSLIQVCENDEVIKKYNAKVGIVTNAKLGVYVSPNKIAYIIVSFVIGLVLSLLVVLLKETVSNKFKSKDAVEKITNKLIIGIQYQANNKKIKHSNYKQISLIEPTQNNFESYNKLLSNIHYANIDNPIKTIMVSSSVVDELKSTVSANLAYCIANNKKKVLLIDLDTRRPVLHRTFNVERANGLVDFVDGKVNKEDIIKHTQSGVDLITIGEKILNPIILLESNKLKELINSLKNEYDYIIIDTPPVLLCTDALIVSEYCDGVVFNVALNATKKKDTLDSIKALENVNANIIGINITNATRSKNKSYYYYSKK